MNKEFCKSKLQVRVGLGEHLSIAWYKDLVETEKMAGVNTSNSFLPWFSLTGSNLYYKLLIPVHQWESLVAITSELPVTSSYTAPQRDSVCHVIRYAKNEDQKQNHLCSQHR